MVLLLLSLACAPTNLAVPLRDGRLSVNATSLSFGEVGWARAESRSLVVQNDGFDTTSVTVLVSGAGFSADRAGFTLGAGAAQVLTLRFSPTTEAPSDGALRLVQPDFELEVTLRGATALDGDGDGADASAWGGPDCDDLDAEVSPDAEERWYDGQDQDCDGGSDFDQDQGRAPRSAGTTTSIKTATAAPTLIRIATASTPRPVASTATTPTTTCSPAASRSGTTARIRTAPVAQTLTKTATAPTGRPRATTATTTTRRALRITRSCPATVSIRTATARSTRRAEAE
ncbi:hypothetical protein L6R49_31670 [Myxococcota bacterium]|nr:hypothetical protein [Myxococcota bacterium]